MKTFADIKKQIRILLLSRCDTNIDISNEELKLTFEDLNMDSLDLAEFVLSMEECFKIEIKDKDAEKWTCIKDIYDYAENHIHLNKMNRNRVEGE